MSSFMTEFNIAYNAMAKDENTKLPQAFLMFMIMGEGGLSAQERLMLMTMIDINNGDTLYEQARHNMMKIMTGAKEDDNLRFF